VVAAYSASCLCLKFYLIWNDTKDGEKIRFKYRHNLAL